MTFVIDHALPYSPPLSVPSRPPAEETRHDHWNKAACFRHSGKKGRRNQLVAKRGCPGSINRAHCLQEGIIQCGHSKVNTSFECHHFPLLFIAGSVTDSVALEHLVSCMPSSDLRGHIEAAMETSNLPQVPAIERRSEVPVLYLLEVEGDGAQCLNVGCVFKINGRLTISNAEILQCHTFTKCLLCTVVPPGYTIGDLCTPPESYQVHGYFSLGEITKEKHPGFSSQVYSGVSAIDPNVTREQSVAIVNTGGSPDSAPEQIQQIQQEMRGPKEQLSPTLPWSTKPTDAIVPLGRNNQQPIVPFMTFRKRLLCRQRR